MEYMGIAGVAAITVICYLVGEIAKALPLANKFIPVICGLAGAALGWAAMFIMPDFPGGDVITSVAIGIVSGLAATGVNEASKIMRQEK